VEGCNDFGGGNAIAIDAAEAATRRSLMLVLAERVPGAEAEMMVDSIAGALPTTGRSGNNATDGSSVITGAVSALDAVGAITGAMPSPPITRVGSSAMATAAAAAKMELTLRLDVEGLGEPCMRGKDPPRCAAVGVRPPVGVTLPCATDSDDRATGVIVDVDEVAIEIEAPTDELTREVPAEAASDAVDLESTASV
jgi:hypothetical protein